MLMRLEFNQSDIRECELALLVHLKPPGRRGRWEPGSNPVSKHVFAIILHLLMENLKMAFDETSIIRVVYRRGLLFRRLHLRTLVESLPTQAHYLRLLGQRPPGWSDWSISPICYRGLSWALALLKGSARASWWASRCSLLEFLAQTNTQWLISNRGKSKMCHKRGHELYRNGIFMPRYLQVAWTSRARSQPLLQKYINLSHWIKVSRAVVNRSCPGLSRPQ